MSEQSSSSSSGNKNKYDEQPIIEQLSSNSKLKLSSKETSQATVEMDKRPSSIESTKDVDPRIYRLQENQENLESKINELRELNRKRDDELKAIKDIIGDCKTKVTALKNNNIDDSSTNEAQECPLQQFWRNWRWDDPGNWKMATGLILLFCLLSCHACPPYFPKIPGIFGFLYTIVMVYHFVLVTGVPFIREILQKKLEPQTFEQVDKLLMPWLSALRMGLTTISIVLLQVKKCSKGGGCWVGHGIQMLALICSFILELASFSYFDGPSGKEAMAQINKALAIPLAISIIFALW